jgi:hypothetical protein
MILRNIKSALGIKPSYLISLGLQDPEAFLSDPDVKQLLDELRNWNENELVFKFTQNIAPLLRHCAAMMKLIAQLRSDREVLGAWRDQCKISIGELPKQAKRKSQNQRAMISDVIGLHDILPSIKELLSLLLVSIWLLSGTLPFLAGISFRKALDGVIDGQLQLIPRIGIGLVGAIAFAFVSKRLQVLAFTYLRPKFAWLVPCFLITIEVLLVYQGSLQHYSYLEKKQITTHIAAIAFSMFGGIMSAGLAAITLDRIKKAKSHSTVTIVEENLQSNSTIRSLDDYKASDEARQRIYRAVLKIRDRRSSNNDSTLSEVASGQLIPMNDFLFWKQELANTTSQIADISRQLNGAMIALKKAQGEAALQLDSFFRQYRFLKRMRRLVSFFNDLKGNAPLP